MDLRSSFTELFKARFLITKFLILWKLVRYWTNYHSRRISPPSIISRWHLFPLGHKPFLTNPWMFLSRIMDLSREILLSRNHFLLKKDVSKFTSCVLYYDYFSFAFEHICVAGLSNIAVFEFPLPWTSVLQIMYNITCLACGSFVIY